MARILRLEAVQAKIGGLCRTTIWKLEKEGQFPKRRALTTKIVGWDEKEINEWIKSRDPQAGFTPNIHRKPKGNKPK